MRQPHTSESDSPKRAAYSSAGRRASHVLCMSRPADRHAWGRSHSEVDGCSGRTSFTSMEKGAQMRDRRCDGAATPVPDRGVLSTMSCSYRQRDGRQTRAKCHCTRWLTHAPAPLRSDVHACSNCCADLGSTLSQSVGSACAPPHEVGGLVTALADEAASRAAVADGWSCQETHSAHTQVVMSLQHGRVCTCRRPKECLAIAHPRPRVQPRVSSVSLPPRREAYSSLTARNESAPVRRASSQSQQRELPFPWPSHSQPSCLTPRARSPAQPHGIQSSAYVRACTLGFAG